MIILFFGALLMVSSISTTNVRGQDQSATTKFRRVTRPIPNQYIVVLNDDTSSSEVASRAVEMARASGGIVGHIYRYALSGFAAQMSESAAIELSLDPRVEFVEEDGEVFAGTTQLNPPSWGLDRIDQRDLPVDSSYSYTKDATGVNVYVIDTGIRLTHQDFGGRAHFGADCTVVDANGNCAGTGTGDDCDHGTLVASIIGGSTVDPQTSYGVAKNVTLYSVRVLNCTGTFSAMIAGVDWVTNNHVKPAVANMSLQGASTSTATGKSIRRSIAAGVTYIVIAGNSVPPIDASTRSPSDVIQTIVVGATGDDTSPYYSDNRASFSNFGGVLDLFAPGTGITGASSSGDTAVLTDDGTSFASPHVAGDGIGFFNGLIDEVRVTAGAVYSGSSFTTQHRVTGVVLTRGLWRFDNWRSDDTSRLGWDCAQVNHGSVIGGATSSTDVP